MTVSTFCRVFIKGVSLLGDLHGLGSVNQDLYGSWFIKGTGESMVDSAVLLMHHDSDRSLFTEPDPDHPKGAHPNLPAEKYNCFILT